VDNFEGVGNNAESEELLAVVATLHHEANHEVNAINATVVPGRFLWAYLSTNRSTMGIWAFLNCFLA
jgi:hypothetical protein